MVLKTSLKHWWVNLINEALDHNWKLPLQLFCWTFEPNYILTNNLLDQHTKKVLGLDFKSDINVNRVLGWVHNKRPGPYYWNILFHKGKEFVKARWGAQIKIFGHKILYKAPKVTIFHQFWVNPRKFSASELWWNIFYPKGH